MKIAPSATRSSVESQNAPNLLTRPLARAIVPSRRSLNTNAVMTSTPVASLPCGKKTRAPAQTPSVPTRVTASGLTPRRISRWATGEMTFVKKARKRSIMAAAGYRSGDSDRLRDRLRTVEHGLEGELGGTDQRRVVAEPGRPDDRVGARRHQAAGLEGLHDP